MTPVWLLSLRYTQTDRNESCNWKARQNKRCCSGWRLENDNQNLLISGSIDRLTVRPIDLLTWIVGHSLLKERQVYISFRLTKRKSRKGFSLIHYSRHICLICLLRDDKDKGKNTPGRRSSDAGRRSPVAGRRSPVAGRRSSDAGHTSRKIGIDWSPFLPSRFVIFFHPSVITPFYYRLGSDRSSFIGCVNAE